MRYSRPLVLLAATGLAACGASMRPSVRARGGSITDAPRIGAVPTDVTRDPSREPGRTDAAPSGPTATPRNTAAPERRVCRRSAWPTGWLAVAYVAGDDGCAKGQTKEDRAVAIL